MESRGTWNVGYTAEQWTAFLSHAPIIQNGTWHVWDVERMQYVSAGIAASGTSAYDAAVSGGYTGTEAEFYGALASVNQSVSDAENAASEARSTARSLSSMEFQDQDGHLILVYTPEAD